MWGVLTLRLTGVFMCSSAFSNFITKWFSKLGRFVFYIAELRKTHCQFNIADLFISIKHPE